MLGPGRWVRGELFKKQAFQDVGRGGGYPWTGTLGESLREDEPALSSGPGVWDPRGLRGGGVGTAQERGPGLLS